MRKTEAFLCAGIVFFVSWLLIDIIHPWLGFMIGAAGFLALIGFTILLFIGHLAARRT